MPKSLRKKKKGDTMKTTNIPALRETLRSANPNSRWLSLVAKKIADQDVCKLQELIRNRKPIADYSSTTLFTPNSRSALLNHVLPSIFDDKELEQYFLDMLIQLHNTGNHWQFPGKSKSYKQITGFVFTDQIRTNTNLGVIFNHVYDNIFIPYHLYPQSFIDDGPNLIRNNAPLSSNYSLFCQKYKRHERDSFLKVIWTYYIPNIGHDAFGIYLKNIAAKFNESLTSHDRNTLSNDRFLDYMFGHHWVISTHIAAHKKNNNLEAIRLEKMIIRAIIPYTIANYRSKQTRNYLYSFLDFTEHEKQDLENTFAKSDYQKYYPQASAASYTANDVLRYGSTYQDIFNLIDRAIADLTNNKRKIFSKKEIINRCCELSDDNLYHDLLSGRKSPSLWAQFVNYIDRKIEERYDLFFKNNSLEFQKDVWVIFYRAKDHYQSVTLSFSQIKSSFLRIALKEYCKHTIIENNYTRSHISKLTSAITVISYIEETFGISLPTDIAEFHILSALQYLEVEKGNKPNTLKYVLSVIKGFFKDYSIKHDVSDPTGAIRLSNVGQHRRSTAVIPDDILVYLANHYQDIKQVDYMLACRLLLETGWRFSDIRDIKSKDVTMSDNGAYGQVTVISPKTRKARTKHRLDEYINDFISLELYTEIQQYIADTANIRKVYGIDTLFYSIVNGRVSKLRSSLINQALNNMLRRNGIRSVDDSYLRFTAMQTRKTVASTLISAGASLASGQQKLGHISSQTTEYYYAEVSKKTIADLNDEFYQRQFGVYMDPDTLKRFNEEERRLLYVDF